MKSPNVPSVYEKERIIIPPDKSQGCTGFTNVTPPPYFLTSVHDNSRNAFTDFIPTWQTHVFGSREESYFKVSLNFQ